MSKNTSIKHRHSARTTVIWFLFILVIALTALVIYLFLHQNIEKQSKQDTNNPSQQVQSTSASTSENQSSKNETKEDLEAGKTHQTPKQYEETDNKPTADLTGFITYSGKNDNNLTIRVTINQLLKEVGTCTLSLTSASGQRINRTANTIDNPSSATCQGFDIPLSEIQAGEYQINIEIKTSHQSGNIKGSITI